MAGPTLDMERDALARGMTRIAGVDEVGRGPLAGPVTAAAVILEHGNIPDGLNDSKRLTARRRETLHDALQACAIVSVAHASVEEIDTLNILRAAHLAMQRAVEGLPHPPDMALVDGNLVPKALDTSAKAVVKGDRLSASIAAASIVAKVARDRIMTELAQQFPGYGWETNAGYGSKAHMAALLNLGITPHHRRSFRPIHNILYQEKTITP
ncbi:ribonuclease HII [Roseovarius salis]|uniref:ribonuclease HII n=1 Tax=Roseovarius salis TaxID=3376063 RepID=UPI0037C86D4E